MRSFLDELAGSPGPMLDSVRGSRRSVGGPRPEIEESVACSRSHPKFKFKAEVAVRALCSGGGL